MRPLIGIMGQKRSGKDTAARYLIEKHGYTRYAFADPLKKALYHLNPEVCDGGYVRRLQDVIHRYGWEEAKDSNSEVRRLLQEYGMGIRRIDRDFWVRATMYPVMDSIGDGAAVVISDVRFPNEADAVRKAHGLLLRVDRPGLPDSDLHYSEHAWRDVEPDHTITNDGTLEDLRAQVARIM